MAKNSIKVSIIVAAYNAEKYLEETLESLLHQTIDSYEVIVVNDGSKDSTKDILERYNNQYDNMTVIHKENGGPSSARNAGIDVAKGEFLYFFDADDILELDAMLKMYEMAKKRKADLVIGKYDIFDRYKTTPVRGLDDLVIEKKIGRYDPRILWTFSLCNKLFRKKVIDEYNLRLAPISYSEDGAFLFSYIYRCGKITGIDMVIFHYRRMFDGVPESITASVSDKKIDDYTKAHNIIFNEAKKSIERDFASLGSFDEILEKNVEIHKYINEFIRKELQILLDQFYAKFWTLEDDTIKLLQEEISSKLKIMDMRDFVLLQDNHPEFMLRKLPVLEKEAISQAQFSVALYGDAKSAERFLQVLESLVLQNLVTMVIYVPEHMKKIVTESEFNQGNIFYVDALSERELFYYLIDNAKTQYVTFADLKMLYVNNAFKYALKNFTRTTGDFIAELIYHNNYGEPQAVLLNTMTLNALKQGYEDTPYLAMDYTLANKFFKVEFLRKFDFDKNRDLLTYLDTFYKKTFYPFMNDKVCIYNDLEDTYIDYVGTDETKPFMTECLEEVSLNLDSPELEPDFSEILPKLIRFPEQNILQKIKKKMVAFIKKAKVKNDKVLFISIRKDGELEGNAKALFPYIKGKKVVCAKMLPHGRLTELKMFYHIYTSKIIITDDYVKYFRYFQLRKDQRIIQLWHACGAFKKFGQRGTNMSIAVDNSTHAQYNLMCVSGSFIRTIYADAFNIDINKVCTLGTPRTDYFFDKTILDATKQRVYEKYPQFKDKQVIIYAPTFRDANGDRSIFTPELDFDRLSEKLNDNQIFVVCPHPVMKNDIVEKKYDNILVVRDFSTNDMMIVSDMLITDYSSVIFEYALLRKPIAFYCYDLINYDRGFYLGYPDDLPGEVYETQEALEKFITDEASHTLSEKHELFIEKYMSGCDGKSCERIAKVINDYLDNHMNDGKEEK